MGENFYKVSSKIVVLLIMLAVVGCAKKDQEQTIITETVKESSEKEKEQITDGNNEVLTPIAEEKDKLPTVDGGIKDVYALYGLQAGTCLSDTMIAESKYTDIIKKNYNQITLENYLKPDYILNKTKSIETGELTVEFTKKTTDLLDWAKNNGMKVHGHVLIWHSQTPDWIFYEDFDTTKKLVDRDTMLTRMETYIKQVFEQLDKLGYSDIFYAYDIVNEAIMEDGSYRDSLWKQIIGDDYIWYAFSYADHYAPERIKLYYNDYNEQYKTNYIIKLTKSLVDESGISLIDGIGCQAHLFTEESIDKYIETLKAFSTTGLDVQITELDVSLGTWQNVLEATEENLKTQGQFYYELLNRIIQENKKGTTNVSGITFWGFADNLSWRNDRSPLLFDSNLEPKYSYYGVIQDNAKAGY